MANLAEPGPRVSRPSGSGLRWEWRTFGRRFGVAEERIARLAPGEPGESDEIYFVTQHGDNVKVRDALMDVKVLREVDADGLEQWAPVMKAAFPLSADDASKVAEALRVPAGGALGPGCTLQALEEALRRPNSGVTLVEVHKQRARFTVNGCMAELSEITANGEPIRTIAVESVDAAAVVEAVTQLGLSGYLNTSYPLALAALIAHEPERYAVIDVGTNSVKFHIGERDGQGNWRKVADRAALTRLGEGLADTGRIADAPLERTIEAIAAMAVEAKAGGVRAIAAVGTAGFRIAANGAEAVEAIRRRTGVGIEVVSGEDEARLAFVATAATLGPVAGSIAVFDTGGGSSQFTFGHGGHVDERFSVDVGAARYTERFALDGAVGEDAVERAMAALSEDLARLDGRTEPDALVGMGGAVTNLTAVSLGMAEYDPARIQGATVDASEIDRQIELYRTRGADERRSIAGLQPQRAEVILAGACIVRTVLRKLGKTSLTVSDRGLRHGVLAERFGD